MSTPPQSPFEQRARSSERPTSALGGELKAEILFRGWLDELGHPAVHFVVFHTDSDAIDLDWLVGTEAERQQREMKWRDGSIQAIKEEEELESDWAFEKRFRDCELRQICVPRDLTDIENLTVACPADWVNLENPNAPRHVIVFYTPSCKALYKKVIKSDEWKGVEPAVTKVYQLQGKHEIEKRGPPRLKDRRKEMKEKLTMRPEYEDVTLGLVV